MTSFVSTLNVTTVLRYQSPRGCSSRGYIRGLIISHTTTQTAFGISLHIGCAHTIHHTLQNSQADSPRSNRLVQLQIRECGWTINRVVPAHLTKTNCLTQHRESCFRLYLLWNFLREQKSVWICVLHHQRPIGSCIDFGNLVKGFREHSYMRRERYLHNDLSTKLLLGVPSRLDPTVPALSSDSGGRYGCSRNYTYSLLFTVSDSWWDSIPFDPSATRADPSATRVPLLTPPGVRDLRVMCVPVHSVIGGDG